MASVRKEDIPEVAKFMTDFWELIKMYYKPEDTDEYWECFNEDAEKLYTSTDHILCRKMILDLTSYLEGKLRGRNTTRSV